ncbi:lytic transglycosylase domain-containing protein [Acetobacter sp.]|uniref:lytic transglycosylase domain-containing protein n=1 Tax=Acetobacter sp. TaxID=440 RepID=UPI0039E8EBB3
MADDIERHYEGAGKYWGVDPEVLRAIHAVEDPTGDPTIKSRAGAIGHMQIMPETARSLGIDPRNPVQSIYGAARVMRENLDRYKNLPDALRAYNAGTDRTRWNNNETNAYVGRVAAAYRKPETQAMPKTPVADPMTDDDAFDKAWGVKTPAAQTTAPAAHEMSDEEFDRMWGVGKATPKQGRAAPEKPTTAPPKYEEQNWWNNALAGGVRGLRDVADSAIDGSNWLLKKAGSNIAQGAADYEKNALNDYNRDYGGSLAAKIGRVGSDIAATAFPVGGTEVQVGRWGTRAAEALGVTNWLAHGAGALAGSSAAGATANALLNGGSEQGLGQALKDGAIGGALTGGALAAIKPIARGATEAFTGGTVAADRAALARKAQDFGIDLTAPQISQSPNMQWMADVANGGNASAKQLKQFTRAVSRTFGQDSEALTPELLDDAHNALGTRFDHAAAQTIIRADNQFGNDIGRVADEARQVLPESEVRPIENQIANIMGQVSNGQISGPQYQAIIRQGAPLSRAMRSKDPNVAYYAGQLRDAFDDAMERSLVADGKQDVLDDFRNARFQYKNLKTVEPLALKAQANGGAISPALLQNAVNKSFKDRARKGAGDLGHLADIGQAFLKERPQSGTAPRIGAEIALSELPAAVMGHGLGAAGTVLGVAAGRGAAKSAARAYLNSPRLANALLTRSEPQPEQNQLLGDIIDTARRGLPYAAAVPVGDQVLRNALLGY